MRHPFAGILVANDLSPSRREVLKSLAAAGLVAGGLLASPAPAQDDGADEEGADEETADRDDYAAWWIVPKDFRKFDAKRRAELGVHGPYFTGDQASKPMKGRGGFLAWLTAEQADKIKAAEGVGDVHKLEAADKPSPQDERKGATELLVHVIPGDFKEKPPKGSYQPVAALVVSWREKFSDGADIRDSQIKFELDSGNRGVVVNLGAKEPPKEMLEALKEHPQVTLIEWNRPVSTLALGEEGGPAPTTKRLGEEGGPGPTTLALGEEGGPTTEAIGEEGGPTTLGRGEEGGPIPLPSSRARGEEGGVSTKALGEEGGPAKGG